MAISSHDKEAKTTDHVEALTFELDAIDTLRGVAALKVAERLEPVQKLSKGMVQLYVICGFMFLGASLGGYDASLMGNLMAMPFFQAEFDAQILGAKTGLISSMYSIGAVSALPFVGPCGDTWGRRPGIALGCVIVIIGTVIQGTSHHLPQYLAGRFFLGFGGTVASVVPAYIVEIAHPTYRGVIGGLYNCCYYVGSVLAAIVLRGCVGYQSNQSWLIPTWFQMALPSILLISIFFFPESPRWQFSHGQVEKCRASLIKYHGNGDSESLYVKLQLREFAEELELNGADKRWWDYRTLFNSRASLYRVILCAVSVPAFSQWTGQAGVSYFLPAMLSTMGVTSTLVVLDINLGLAVASGIAACIGASCMDFFGRRKTLITCCLVLVVMWAGMLACTGTFNASGSDSSARASIAFIFLVGISFSFGYTPLQQLYAVEVLRYEQRAKGIAFAAMMMSGASLVNLFATPIALEKIAWKTYYVWLAACAAQAIYYYFFMVETKGHTLEEMNYIFNQKNPKKASLEYKDNIIEGTKG
ncbi:MFS sugar transporter-like protein [Talaromyces proteolyticus]|uniref:MFS sugar transporter-like protein n=1 Tax=Talaromyces proteolyticus TaxID=1131652 RepID=A0AAD4PW58_9EURO|nr:MFS sugar transporter-like protein [Talaromyces proteolyticus]KAH8697485.1 MFS sugar transporter-like protein [Talaromyces proteolyticus]